MSKESSTLEESVFDYFNIFIKDDLKHECIERGKSHYTENDFKDYILESYEGWGGDPNNNEAFWSKHKPIVKSAIESIGVYKKNTISLKPKLIQNYEGQLNGIYQNLHIATCEDGSLLKTTDLQFKNEKTNPIPNVTATNWNPITKEEHKKISDKLGLIATYKNNKTKAAFSTGTHQTLIKVVHPISTIFKVGDQAWFKDGDKNNNRFTLTSLDNKHSQQFHPSYLSSIESQSTSHKKSQTKTKHKNSGLSI